jgi:hypothetical protein
MMTGHLDHYKPALLSLPDNRPFTKEDLLVDDFLMERSGQLEMYYSPHNEYVNLAAKVIIIGITPGWTQMKIAFQEARTLLGHGLPDEEVGKRAKQAARFAGSMRRNLITMLNRLELHHVLNISSCEDLFGAEEHLLHSTSLLPYPLFLSRNNYTGSHPNLLSNPFLRHTALSLLGEQLQGLTPSLIIPLGKTVDEVLHVMEHEGKIDARRCLWGFPHPSGVNAHRHRQLESKYGTMKMTIQSLFDKHL